MNPAILPQAIVEQNGLFNLGMVTNLGKEKTEFKFVQFHFKKKLTLCPILLV